MVFLQGSGEGPVFDQISEQGLSLERREVSNILLDECFRLFEKPSFCFQTFGVRRFIDCLHPEKQPGTGKLGPDYRALGLTEDV